MLSFKYENNWYEIEYFGIKIIETKFTTNFIKSIISEDDEQAKLIIENKSFKWKNILYINEMTRYSDLISLNKNSIIYKKIIEYIGDESLIKDEIIDSIIKNINQEFEFENLLIKQYDINKIINSSLSINNSNYVEKQNLFKILNKLEFDEKKLIIFDNVNYINYEICKQLLNNFNILIVCTDIRGIIDNINQLELCCFINDKKIFDVINQEKLTSYLELKMSLPISNLDIANYLENKNDQKSSIIHFYLKNIS